MQIDESITLKKTATCFPLGTEFAVEVEVHMLYIHASLHGLFIWVERTEYFEMRSIAMGIAHRPMILMRSSHGQLLIVP